MPPWGLAVPCPSRSSPPEAQSGELRILRSFARSFAEVCRLGRCTSSGPSTLIRHNVSLRYERVRTCSLAKTPSSQLRRPESGSGSWAEDEP